MRELEGIRVLEYGPWVNTAYAGKLLADLGAEVVKIEAPEGDQPSRASGPFPGDLPDAERSAVHLYDNCNKFGVTLDPASPTGRELFLRLVARADVLIDGTQPGRLDRLGLGYQRLRAVNERLSLLSLSSLGCSGPKANWKSYDLISWHASGTGHVFLGSPDREPLISHWRHASHWGGVNAAAAALIALRARDKTGRGQFVDISEAEALATLFLAVEVSDFIEHGDTKVRDCVKGIVYQTPASMRQAKGGWVYIMAIAPHQWEGLVRAMGNPEWAQSELFKGTGRQRVPYADEIYALMDEWLATVTPDEVFERCQANGAPAAPVLTVEGMYQNEHLNARGFFVEVEHDEAGRLRIPGAPFRISGDPWHIDRPAPRLGEHNERYYCDVLGLSKHELPSLRRAGVI